MRGFFIGRFQPFHRGHRQIVTDLATEVDELVIGIGSAEYSHTQANPFTAGERMEMIHATVRDEPAPTFIVPITDTASNAKWVAHVTGLSPTFDVVYTNNPLVDRLFTEAGVSVRGMPLYNRDEYRGTEIRRRIRQDEPWQSLVPDEVASVLVELDGIDRIHALTQKE